MDEPLDGRIFGDGQPCFGCAPDHPFGFRLRFDRDGQDVVTHFTPGERYQGPPGVMHGGLVMTLADEVAAWAVLATTGLFGFTGKVTCKLHRPVRIGVPVEGRARVVKDLRRLVDVEVVLRQDGQDAFTGEMRFAVLDAKGAEAVIGRALPTSWQRFAR